MREQINLNADWRFHLGEVEDGGYMGLCDDAWARVTLPHDWSVEHPFDQAHSSGTGYLPGGVGWYRKRFTITGNMTGRRAVVKFGGVYKNSRCWINSNYLGMRPYGYSTFRHDITEYLKQGENVLCVRAEHIDLADSRWFTGNGVTRDVTLTIMDEACFEDDGVFVFTQDCGESRATLRVEYSARAEGEVVCELLDGRGQTVATAVARGARGAISLAVDHPKLWSPDSPALYTLRAKLLVDGATRDSVDVVTGIRAFRFDPDAGFSLNGVSMKLKGVCVHHDAGALGAAVPKAVWARRLRALKKAGCNAVRFSHNPPDEGLVELCDELGFLAIDEAFDEWEGCKNKWWQGHNVYPPKHFGYADAFPDWHEKDLSALVLRDRNHPSVILWSIGNEIDYPNDPYVHPSFESMTGNNDANKPAQERQYDPCKPNAERLTTVARELAGIVRRLDPTRPVNSALSFPELSVPTGYAAALDVVGFNYKEQLYEKTHREHPGFCLLGTENGQHIEAWRAVKDNDYVSGQFLWTGVDFLGEARGWPERISHCGLLTMAGFEKPLFALRRAMWTDEPTARLTTGEEGTVWTDIFGWEYEEGQAVTVTCWTNCERAELFVNGQSKGALDVRDYHAQWQAPFERGELRVVCTREGGEAASDTILTPGEAARLALNPIIDGSIAQVEARLTDENGVPVVLHDQSVRYEATGAAILGIENGCPTDITPYPERSRATYQGQAIIYLRLNRGEKAVLRALSDTGIQASVEL